MDHSFKTLALYALICITSAGLAQTDAAAPSLPSSQPNLDYVLQASDLIRVQVFQEEDLLREVRLSQEGSVSLPLIGSVELKGKTLRQAEELIRGLYDKDYIVNPQLNIMVLEYAKKTVSVLGSVATPGPIVFPPEQSMSLLEGVARAGGFTRLADRKRVKLVRTLPDGKTETYVINADDLIQSTKSDDKWNLQKDDVIFVPERMF